MNEDKSYLQKLMNEAYGRWQNNDAAARQRFLAGIAKALGCEAVDAARRFEEVEPTLRRTLEQQYRDDQWSQEEFYDRLSAHERVAVLVGNLNYQVGNGGFSQWVFNGYAEADGQPLLRLLNRVKTPAALEAAEMVGKVLRLVEEAEEGRSYSRSYRDDEQEEDAEEHAAAEIERLGLDSQFYEMNDQLLEDVEAALLSEVVAEAWEAGKPMSFTNEGRTVRVVAVTLSVTLGMVLDVTPFEDCGDTHVSQEVRPNLRQLQEVAVSLGMLEEVGVADETGLDADKMRIGQEFLTPEGHRMRYEGIRPEAVIAQVVPYRFSWVEPKYHGEHRYSPSMIARFVRLAEAAEQQ